MKKTALFVLCACMALAGCVVRGAAGAQGLSPAAQNVKIVGVQPRGCEFVAGVMGDQNGGEPGVFPWVESVTREVSDNLKRNAARLGGNVVYLRSAYMGKPDVSNDYMQQFYINGVQYGGLIYKCP